MTETLSEFRQRVARLQTDFRYSHAHAVWHAMLVPVYGAADEQEHWIGKMLSQQGSEAVNALLYADEGADAFLRAAVTAGVLLDDMAQELPDGWRWLSQCEAIGERWAASAAIEDGVGSPSVHLMTAWRPGQYARVETHHSLLAAQVAVVQWAHGIVEAK